MSPERPRCHALPWVLLLTFAALAQLVAGAACTTPPTAARLGTLPRHQRLPLSRELLLEAHRKGNLFLIGGVLGSARRGLERLLRAHAR